MKSVAGLVLMKSRENYTLNGVKITQFITAIVTNTIATLFAINAITAFGYYAFNFTYDSLASLVNRTEYLLQYDQ